MMRGMDQMPIRMARCAATRADLTHAQRALARWSDDPVGPAGSGTGRTGPSAVVAVVHSVSSIGFNRRGDAVASTFGLNTAALAAGGIAFALNGPRPETQ
jgi:hypothetical protein